jgi:zinc protease
MLDRTIPPAFKPLHHIDLKEASTIRLDNGLKIHIVDQGNFPVVKMELLIKAGTWNEKKSGTSYLTAKLLSEGTKLKTSKEITQAIDQLGAFIDIHPGMDYISVTFYFLTKHTSAILPVIHEIMFESTFPEEEITTQKILKSQNIKLNKEKNSIVASKLLRENLFGSHHPYGRDISENDLQNITREDLIVYYTTCISQNFEIIISGKVKDSLINEITSFFGKDKIASTSEPVPLFASLSNQQAVLLEKEKSLQSSIRLGKCLFTRKHEDYVEMLIVNEILGGYFGSRLMKNIREDKGFTYGISSSVISLKNDGYFVLGTDVKKENTQQTLDEIRHEIKKLQTEPVPEEELTTVKNYMLGNFLSEINTPFSLADKFKSIYFNDLGYDYYQHYFNTINHITQEKIMEIAYKHIGLEDLTEVVVGGK